MRDSPRRVKGRTMGSLLGTPETTPITVEEAMVERVSTMVAEEMVTSIATLTMEDMTWANAP